MTTENIDEELSLHDRRKKNVPPSERGAYAYMQAEKRKGPKERRANPRPQTTNLAGFLKRLRMERGFTLRQAGLEMGINDAYLWQLENGKREIPRPDTLEKLAKGYGIPHDYLLTMVGYLKSQDEVFKGIDETQSSSLMRDYQRLSDDGKEKLKTFLRFLQKEDRKK